MIVLFLLVTRCSCQRWLLLGGYTGFEGESGAGATSQVIGDGYLNIMVVVVDSGHIGGQ